MVHDGELRTSLVSAAGSHKWVEAHLHPDITTAATYDEAAAQLVEAGFVPRLTFGDAQGAIRSFEVDGRTPDIGETFRRGTQVDIEAL